MRKKIVLMAIVAVGILLSQCKIQQHLCPCDSLAEDSILGYHLKMDSDMWAEVGEDGKSVLSLMVRVEAVNRETFPDDLVIEQYGVSFATKDGLSNYFTSHQAGDRPNVMEFYSKPVMGVALTDTVNIAIQIVRNKEVNFLKNDSLYAATLDLLKTVEE
ncbi:hypothetical protein K5X82_07825 [Halosquirtibacter xylanolyticus]|uniref:hypothetical protein n=1 Tax=Halosquirtibacter xylanolyticus TaxID=3374599 RepID=UPI003748DEA4|nr:hypothetical protein K5X82_07825 [Prolixibacteraceae bacterium]